MKITEQHHKAADLLSQGLGNGKVAAQIGKSVQTINNWKKSAEFQALLFEREDERIKSGEILDYQAARAKKEHFAAAIAELEYKKVKGELLNETLVEKVWSGMIANCRAKLLALPDKAAFSVMGVNDVQESMDIIRELVHEALNELKELKAIEYGNPSSSETGSTDLDTAAKPDRKPVGRPRKAAQFGS